MIVVIESLSDSLKSFSDIQEITLPYTATNDCFLFIKICSNVNGNVYLKSKLFGTGIYRATADTDRGNCVFTYPVKKGDTLTVDNIGNIVDVIYWVMELK